MDPLAALEEALASAAAMVAGAGTVDEIERVDAALLGRDSAVGRVRRSMAGLR